VSTASPRKPPECSLAALNSRKKQIKRDFLIGRAVRGDKAGWEVMQLGRGHGPVENPACWNRDRATRDSSESSRYGREWAWRGESLSGGETDECRDSRTRTNHDDFSSCLTH
jgi:hypothetical protein